ncbi:piggyBac transposable element-derived protein 4-like [Schistocerca piceifrons]|uniref:piggyBac transposable element-derived protein 4-like n=1 Tax=Schistocerca piceifrons TaxID=274613 RepID=UPI001F5E9227|nr:piggyBac transposable element-derived protein 4-like [Schistocerca piceifrons]
MFYNSVEDIERLLLQSSDEENYADFSDSDEEAEIIETADHSSESEQSCVDWDEVKGMPHDGCHFYVGKDQETLWINNALALTGKPKREYNQPGPKCNGREAKTETESFLKLFDSEIIDYVIANTNKYINNKRSSVNYSRARVCEKEQEGNYSVIFQDEITALLGALFLIAVQKGGRTNILELWASSGTGLIILRAAFSYKHFLFLLRSLKFDDTSTRKEQLVTAIGNLHSAFLINCINNYSPGEFTTIDKMLDPFHGRCGFVQYMPNKPVMYGLKLYALCDSKTFYTFNFEVYCSRQNPGPYFAPNQPMDIVKRLVEPIKGTHRNVTTDNYYSSYPAALHLLENGLTFIGTLKKNKKEITPECLPNRSREIGNCLFGFQDDNCLVSCQTKRNKAVLFPSSMHGTAEIDTATGKSVVNLDYNTTKGGVDTVDYMCTSYSTQRTTRRWSLALFFRYLDIAGINSQVLFFASNPEKRTYLTNLALALMDCHLKERAQLSTLPRDIQGYLSPNQPIPANHDETVRRCGRCHLCSGKKKIKLLSLVIAAKDSFASNIATMLLHVMIAELLRKKKVCHS